MGLTAITVAEIQKHLPARILALGYPDNIERANLTGSTLTCVDIVAHHGMEIVADLSILQDLGRERFDLVIDSGTTEHVANIANAFVNAASAVRVGGHIIHEIPLNMVNHGYWNISPVWFEDFYRANRFVIERIDRTLSAGYDVSRVLPWPGGDFRVLNCLYAEHCCTLCVARRTNNDPIGIPRCQDVWTK